MTVGPTKAPAGAHLPPSDRGYLRSSPPAPDEVRRARLALLGVASLWVAVHVLWAGLDRPINWDEAIHLTQVVPARSTVFLEPHRTRGVGLLVAPIGLFDPSMSVLRAYLAITSGIAIFASFATWIRTLGYAAPLGAALFTAFAVTVFYGVEVLPNLPTALAAVAVAGLTAQVVSSSAPIPPRQLWGAAGLMALLALLRPPDAALVGVMVAVTVMAMRPRVTWPFVTAAGAGGIAGLLPWFVEGAVRFGFGPIQLLRSGGEYGTNADVMNRLPIYIRFLEGPYRCSRSCERDLLEDGSLWASPGTRTLLFLVVSGILVVVAARYAGRRRRPALVAFLVGAPILALYATFSIMNQRYILPVIALWLLVPAVGAVTAWFAVAGQPSARALRLVAAVTLVLALGWQYDMGTDRLRNNMGSRVEARELGLELAAASEGRPCAVATATARPMIEYWSGCRAVNLEERDDGAIQDPVGELDSYVDLAELQAAGHRIFALAEDVDTASPVSSWSSTPLADGVTEGWVLYEHDEGDPLPSAPCPSGDGPERILGGVLSPHC